MEELGNRDFESKERENVELEGIIHFSVWRIKQYRYFQHVCYCAKLYVRIQAVARLSQYLFAA